MTYEEMQKTMQFILEQQAQFTVDIQQLKESQTKTDENVSQLTGVVAILAAETRAGFEEVRGSIAALVDAQIRNEENIKETNEAVRNLTAVVDRYFRERNGQQDSE
ncbi:MAG TPA: hypothetical protein VJ866_02355 [Pyrinomonadaceae bacterium]|nr:hypothetical protein [Pyrinomonadaceae bacterium]